MVNNDLLILATRCEASTSADRAIDGDIAEVLKLAPEWAVKRGDRQPDLFTDNGPGLRARTWLAPKFTASLDAAMMLVPVGFRFELCTAFEQPYANVWHTQQHWGDAGDHYAATPALALTAASLRALSNSPEEKEG